LLPPVIDFAFKVFFLKTTRKNKMEKLINYERIFSIFYDIVNIFSLKTSVYISLIQKELLEL